MHADVHLREWEIPPEQTMAATRAVMDDDIAGMGNDREAIRIALQR